ncbi:hypothetical protein [Nocardioides halotolerans]|uniref:hypothetical protein n=1 Tax=Nocardioides halotolerans TaxID=433660 RepID=UPI00048D7FA2|nr:hypothetical protein [Nocardioides halotolerans]
MGLLGDGKQVRISECFLRDGLQAFHAGELVALDTATRVDMVERLLEAGVDDIEATSFAHPTLLPQFADAEEVVRQLPAEARESGAARALVPNVRGLERAIDAGLRSVTAFLTCSEAYQAKNVGKSIQESLLEIESMWRVGADAGLNMSADLGTTTVCPFEGEIPRQRVLEVLGQLRDIGIREVTIADTLGMSDPGTIYDLLRELKGNFPDIQYGVHLHNRHGVASVGVLAALDADVVKIDASLLGVGSGTVVPVDKATMGNVATEEVVYVLNSLGYETGIDFKTIRNIALDMSKLVRPVPMPRITLHGDVTDYVSEYIDHATVS